MSTVLIIEDEQRISAFIAKGMKAAGLTTSTAQNAATGYELAASNAFDLVILDLGLPDEDGFSLLARLRSAGMTTPVIILTARDGIDDTVMGLQNGADDYMTKPFHFDELLARVRLRLRPADANPASSVLEYDGLSMDLLRHTVFSDGREIELSSREFALAETFMRNPEQVLSREQILSRVWGYDFDPGSNVVDVYVRYLRSKLGAARLETVRGVGYRLVCRR
ncbi:DNA-binding response regulator [Glutamicibacter uratoxydans]|uniref:DNA-binding response regulator n=1 Tax=Glutamicibacter uratoxydans TaxID=43667 RepID=A0A4Y4DQ10_GLUUR|nr:response regulator transcription factor [Glutamicibacter uratoxydans]GED07432.1 DNA-binding response regulator [Glutamicibacter uratoxydans]